MKTISALLALWEGNPPVTGVFDCDDDTYGSPLLFYDKAVIVGQNMFNGNFVSRACNYIQVHNINEIYEIGACTRKLFLTVWQ